MVKAVGVGLDRGRCVVGLEGWRNKLIVGFEEVDSTVSLTVTVNKERKKKMEASALKRLVEREKAEKRITDQAKAAGFVMGSSVCSLFGSTVYDGKVTLIDAQTGLSVTFSDGDVKQYTIEQLREAIRVGQAAREKAAREKAARVSFFSFFLNFFINSFQIFSFFFIIFGDFDLKKIKEKHGKPQENTLGFTFELDSRVGCLLHEEIGLINWSPSSFSSPSFLHFFSFLTFLSRCHCQKIVSPFYFFFFQGGKSKFFNAVSLFFFVSGRR